MIASSFWENFGNIANAPNGVSKLREMILCFALQGKIVEQNPADAPAKGLLAEVEAEKEKLIREHKLKAPKELLAIRENELTYPLPKTWEWVRFGTIALHNSGKTLDQQRNSGQPRDYITTSNLYWGRFDLRSLRQMLIKDEELDRCTAVKGDLLICEGGEAGRAAVWESEEEVSFQNHVHRARFYAKIDPYFAYRFFQKLNATGEINQYRKGVGISSMSGKVLASIVFPLPPLAEQKRIVAKVDELMALCDQLEAQQQERERCFPVLSRTCHARFAEAPTPANLNRIFYETGSVSPADLRKTIINFAVQGLLVNQEPMDEPAFEAWVRIQKVRLAAGEKDFGSLHEDEIPFAIPRGWCWIKMGNLALSSDSGWSPQCESIPRNGTNWGVLKVSAVSWNEFNPDENKAFPAGMTPRPECEVHNGDFLLSRANTEELVARSVVVTTTPPHLMMSDKIVRFTFPEEIEKRYINLANSATFARSHYAKHASGTSSSMKNVGRGTMCNLAIPFPPLAEQRRIVAKVDELMAMVDHLEAQQQERDKLAEAYAKACVASFTGTTQLERPEM